MNHNQQLTLPNTLTSYVHIRHSYCHPPRTITTLSCDEVCESIHKGGHSGTQEPESPGECQTPRRTPRETRRRLTMSNDPKKRRRSFGTRGRNTGDVVDPSVPGVETPETSAILPKTSRYGPSTRGETPKNVSECNCVAVVHSPPGSTKNKRKIMYCSA